MWGQRRWQAALGALLTLVALVGCGGSSGGGSPKNGLLSGLDGLSGSDRLTTTIRLDTAPTALQALARSSGDTLDARTASIITGAQIVIETVKGSGLDVRAVANGSTLVELRAVNDNLYIQGDVRGILTLINKPKVYGNLLAETKSMPSFVRAALTGQWVSLPSAALTSLAALTGGSASSPPNSGPRLLGDLRSAINKHVTVTESGTDSRGTHYVLHADTNALAADLRSSLQSSVPGGALLSQRLPTQVSHQNVRFDAWVKDGAVSELSIDLLQFDTSNKAPAGTTLPLTVTFDRTGDDITVPSGAEPVDLTQLGTLVGALSGGG